VRQGRGPQMGRWMTAGLWESPERAAAALTAAFDFVAAIIDASTPSEVDPVLYPIRAAQPLREGSLSKKAAMEMLAVFSSKPDPDPSVLPAALWMQKISDALASVDPQRIRKCPLCQDRLFYARRLDQKACSVKHARLLRSTRWLRTGKGKKHYAELLKNPKKSRLLHQPDVEHGGRRRR
jgi:hypothetical protein